MSMLDVILKTGYEILDSKCLLLIVALVLVTKLENFCSSIS